VKEAVAERFHPKRRAGDALHLACIKSVGAKRIATLYDVLSRNAQRLKIKLVALRGTT
jgi:uncharacterized protein